MQRGVRKPSRARASRALSSILLLTAASFLAGPSMADGACTGRDPAGDGMVDGWYGWPGHAYTFTLAQATGTPTWTWSDGTVQTGPSVDRSFDGLTHHDVTVRDADGCEWTRTFHSEHTLHIEDEGSYDDDEHCLYVLELPGPGATPALMVDGHCEWYWLGQILPWVGDRDDYRGRVYADDLIAYTHDDRAIRIGPDDLDVPDGRYDIRACFSRIDDKHALEVCEQWGDAIIVNTDHL